MVCILGQLIELSLAILPRDSGSVKKTWAEFENCASEKESAPYCAVCSHLCSY